MTKAGRGGLGTGLVPAHTATTPHLVLSEVDVGQAEVDSVQVGGAVDVVNCPLVAVPSGDKVPHQVVGVAQEGPGVGVLRGDRTTTSV